jgi:16S rRNA C1402 (ribose-2'-O) methylase RsmI
MHRARPAFQAWRLHLAILTALVGSEFPDERFCFRGFLPVKSGQREREVRAAAEREEDVSLL